MNGGSATLESIEVSPFSPKYREWFEGLNRAITFVYRATH